MALPSRPRSAWDFAIVGSGFGGSVSALRLVEKGYRVLLLEKGRRFAPEDFPKTNWELPRWFWFPRLRCFGPFQMSFYRHVTVVSGVGYGGGSLVYANTLPHPSDEFFHAASWERLADWKRELEPHYATARRMLGATTNPILTDPDRILEAAARRAGLAHAWSPTEVAVFFGEPGVTVADPYFGGRGPPRTGCIACGGCMLGCRHGAKNTLDRNYLYLAEASGLSVSTETEVIWVRPSEGGYEIVALEGRPGKAQATRVHRARNVVFAGGVLGTVPLLLRLRESPQGLPRLSDRLGEFVRTNSESLIAVTSTRTDLDLSKGIAIGSIVHTDPHSHLEPCRYPSGAGFFRTLTLPHVSGKTVAARVRRLAGAILRHPIRTWRAISVRDWAKRTLVLLFMRTLEGSLRMRRGRSLYTGFARGVVTDLGDGPAPTASIPEATAWSEAIARDTAGLPQSLLTETLLGIPTTAHILGGCTMGDSIANGVIDSHHQVFGYEGLYVVDGSAVSANPGVNPSLTITALAERAMSFIPAR